MLEGKVCVVTGSAVGIGRATAIEMASRNAGGVVVADANEAGGAETVELLEDAGGAAHYVHCDVRSEESVQHLMAEAAERFGGIDVLVNNAGVHEGTLTADAAVDAIGNDVWDAVYEVNLRGVWWCTKHAAPYLRRSRKGPSIVNASSTAGLTGYPMSPCYAATKGAVIQLTKATALDLAADGVRCNCFCPGAIDTPMGQGLYEAAEDKEAIKALVRSHLVPRLGRPEEVAKLICFLSSDDAAFINGTAILIDGGSLAWRGTKA